MRITAGEHIRAAIQLAESLLQFGSLGDVDRHDLRAATRRLWRALHEIERGNA